MSNTKRALELAVETHAPRLNVDPDALNGYVMSGEARTFVGHGYAPVPPAVHSAAYAFGIYPPDLLAWWLTARATPPDDLDASVAAQTARDGFKREVVRDDDGLPLVILVHRPPSDGTTSTDVLPAAALVSEDDYRGLAADLVARWADGHMAPHDALASLNLAAHGMPVTTPSRRALAKVRAYVAQIGGEDDARDVARHLTAILDEVGA